MMSQWQTMFIYVLLLPWSWDVVAQSPQPVTSDTNEAVDLMLMVDASVYISRDNFTALLASVARFVGTLPVGPSAVHVAALSYSNSVDRSDFTSDPTLAQRDVLDLFYDGQAALTHVAFDVVNSVMTSRRSIRPEAKKIVILITGSFARYPQYSRESAEKLLAADVEIWAVGIEPYIRYLELLDYTRNSSRIILWDRFDVFPPVPLGLSNSISPTAVASTTNAATATPRIEPSTNPSSVETTAPTSTITAFPTTTSTPVGIWTSAATTASAAPTVTGATFTGLSDSISTSLVPTVTGGVSTASISSYGTSFASEVLATLHFLTSSQMPGTIITDFISATTATVTSSAVLTASASLSVDSTYSLYQSLVTSATIGMTSNSVYNSDAFLMSTPLNPSLTTTAGHISLESASSTLSFTHTAANPSLASTAVNPALTSTAVNPALTSTTMNPALTSTAMNPALTSTAVDPALTSAAVDPSLAPTTVISLSTTTSEISSMASTAVTPVLTPSAASPSTVTTSANPSYSTPITLAPTPTQTDIPVSTTKAADDPRSNNTIDDKLDDGSVVFNSSDKDGLCYKAVASKGFGFVPHPRDCEKFLQCHRSECGTVTASVRLCPRGQFWKQANLTCVTSDQACCKDPCEKICDGQTLRMDGGCGRYWECSRGVSIARRCPIFHAYVPSVGCVFMSTCVDADVSSSSCQFSGKCDSLPLSKSSGYRIQTMSGLFDVTCESSMEFDLASCFCRPLKKLSICCSLVTLLNMTSQIVTDRSVINLAMAQAGCTATQISDHQADASYSTTSCCGDHSPPTDPMRDVTLHFRYVSLNNSGSLPQVLIRSRACVPERGGILVVSEDTSSLDVKVVSSTGYVLAASLPVLALNKTSLWDVHVQYNRGDLFLELTAGDIIYNVYLKGGPHIPVGACGWTVGEPEELSDHLSKFTGNITDILVSRCNEYGV